MTDNSTKPEVKAREMKPRKRRWFAAPTAFRCKAIIKLKDGTTADCMRRHARGSKFCWQHSRAAVSRAEGRST